MQTLPIWDWMVIAILIVLVAGAVLLFARAIQNRRPKERGGKETVAATPVSGPSGFGGWLVLLAIGVYISPLRTILNLSEIEQGVDDNIVQKYRVMFNGEIAIVLAVLLMQIYTAVTMTRKSRNFVSVFIWNCIVIVVSPLIEVIWVASVLNLQIDKPFQTTIQNRATPEFIGSWIGASITVAVWMIYVIRSRRVANTFVR